MRPRRQGRKACTETMLFFRLLGHKQHPKSHTRQKRPTEREVKPDGESTSHSRMACKSMKAVIPSQTSQQIQSARALQRAGEKGNTCNVCWLVVPKRHRWLRLHCTFPWPYSQQWRPGVNIGFFASLDSCATVAMAKCPPPDKPVPGKDRSLYPAAFRWRKRVQYELRGVFCECICTPWHV